MKGGADTKVDSADDPLFDEVMSSLNEIVAEFETIEGKEGTPHSEASVACEVSKSCENAPEEGHGRANTSKNSKHCKNYEEIEDLAYEGRSVYLERHLETEKASTEHYKIRAEGFAAELESTRQELETLKEENDMLGKVSATFSESFGEKTLQLRTRLEMAQHINRVEQDERGRLCLVNQELLDQTEKQRTMWKSLKGYVLSNLGKDEGQLRPQIEAFDKVFKLQSFESKSSLHTSRSDQIYSDEEKRDDAFSPSGRDILQDIVSSTQETLLTNAMKRSAGESVASNWLSSLPRLRSDPGGIFEINKVLKEFSEQERPKGREFQDAMLEQVLQTKGRQSREGGRQSESMQNVCVTLDHTIPSKPLKEYTERECPGDVQSQDAMLERAIQSKQKRRIRFWRD
jgi:hypothetical protein